MFVPRPNTGTLWPNEKRSDNHPDVRGDIFVEISLLKKLMAQADGDQVKLSVSESSDDAGLVDYLGNTASGPSFNKRMSDTILLAPRQTLYVNTANTNFALTDSDVLRVRLFDVAELVGLQSWETI